MPKSKGHTFVSKMARTKSTRTLYSMGRGVFAKAKRARGSQRARLMTVGKEYMRAGTAKKRRK